jgi:ribosomal protein L13
MAIGVARSGSNGLCGVAMDAGVLVSGIASGRCRYSIPNTQIDTYQAPATTVRALERHIERAWHEMPQRLIRRAFDSMLEHTDRKILRMIKFLAIYTETAKRYHIF